MSKLDSNSVSLTKLFDRFRNLEWNKTQLKLRESEIAKIKGSKGDKETQNIKKKEINATNPFLTDVKKKRWETAKILAEA